MLLLAFLGVATSVLVNDYCSGAIAATDTGVNSGTNVGSLYLSQTEYIGTNDVFFKYNATVSGTATVTVNTASQSVDIVVFYGQSCNLLSPEHNYNMKETYGSAPLATSSFPILQGEVYYIAIGGESGYTTAFTFTIATTVTARPAGDTCYNPIAIPANGMSSDLIDGAFQDLDGVISYADEPELFWSYTANCTGQATATLSAPGGISSSLQNFFDNRCGRIIGSGFDQTDQSYESTNASITFPVVNGQSYIIAGGPWSCSAPTGTYTIWVTCAAIATPSNDLCSGAQAITTGLQFVTSNVNAQRNFNDNRCPSSSLSSDEEVWVAWNATCTGTATLNTNSSDIAVIRGSCSDGLAVYCGYGASQSWSVTQGDVLYIAIGIYATSSNNIVGTISCAAVNNVPANTYCANAVAATASQQVSNANAISDPATYIGNDRGVCSSYYTLFFNYVFTCSGQTTITYASLSTTSLTLAIYQDATCNPVAYCYSSYNYLSFNASQGDQFTFSVGNYYETDATGPFWLNISCTGTQSTPTAPTGSTPTAPTGSTPTAPTAKATPTAPTAKATPTAPTAKATPTAPTAPTAPTTPTTATTTKAPSSASVVGFGVATVVSVLLL